MTRQQELYRVAGQMQSLVQCLEHAHMPSYALELLPGGSKAEPTVVALLVMPLRGICLQIITKAEIRCQLSAAMQEEDPLSCSLTMFVAPLCLSLHQVFISYGGNQTNDSLLQVSCF
jgi:hypothetical protein